MLLSPTRTRKRKAGDDIVSRLSSISNGTEFPNVVKSPHFAQPCSQVISPEGDRCSEGTRVFALVAAEPLAGLCTGLMRYHGCIRVLSLVLQFVLMIAWQFIIFVYI